MDDKNSNFLEELLPWSETLPENIRKPWSKSLPDHIGKPKKTAEK